MQHSNVLFLLSDEHARQALGCYGHPLVQTPHLDRLAARGTRFTSAYTPSPICVPARASLATGRYVHRIRYWDNAHPYDGRIPSWAHRLRAQGYHVTAIGKLHYRSSDDDNGFNEEILPLHVVDGVGDLYGLIRDELPLRKKNRRYVLEAGPGESSYTAYDQRITEASIRWLHQEAPKYRERPWVLFVSLVCPHPPLLAPPDFFALYPPAKVPLPVQYAPPSWPTHPAIADLRQCLGMAEPFDEATVRRATAAYLGLCSYLDANLGRILHALEETGLATTTRVIYTSDHGESLGYRGIWGKFTLYEESAGIPLLMAGPDIPQGAVCPTPVSLIDVFPTLLQSVGARPHPEDAELPGVSLLEVANGAVPSRTVLSEYHALGSRAASFMLRHGTYKYIHYVGYPSQLFNLAADPQEVHDLAAHPRYRPLLAKYEAMLRSLLDPEAVDAQAKADQARKIAAHGGKAAIKARGSFGYTPAPGEPVVYE
ncbi:MAG: sulfatase [Candidatus Tectimicrobiota bacterium]|nr:MAG: sulfatase [Candidatus Tectomicrobia bacterium]